MATAKKPPPSVPMKKHVEKADSLALLEPSSPIFAPHQQLFLYTAADTPSPNVHSGDVDFPSKQKRNYQLKLKPFDGHSEKSRELSPSSNVDSQLDGEEGLEGRLPNRRHPFRHLHFWRVIFWVQFAMILAVFLFCLVIVIASGYIVYHVRDAIDKANEALRNNPLSNIMDKFRRHP